MNSAVWLEHLLVVTVPVFNSTAIYNCCPFNNVRPEKVKAPPAEAVAVCILLLFTYKKTVALGSVVPLMLFVAVVKTEFAGDVITGTANVPASALPPLPAAQK